jgi:hypothetical protein
VRIPQPDGGERIILITDRRLGDENELWKPTGAKDAASANVVAKADGAKGSQSNTDSDAKAYEFSIVELHLNARGQGEGKISLNDKVTVDNAAKVLALDNYGALPVVLKSVDRQSLGKS